MLPVKEIIKTEVYTIDENSTVRELLQLFVEKQVSGVPVVGKNNKLLGIITDADILREIQQYPSFLDFINYVVVIDADFLADAKIANLLDTPVKKLMTKNVVTVQPDTSLASASNLLSKKKFKKLPVVEGGKLVGIITRSDIVQYLVREFLKLV